jgi:hypothetical protein
MSTTRARRQLLRGAAITASAASYSRILGSNDKMGHGPIGTGECPSLRDSTAIVKTWAPQAL